MTVDAQFRIRVKHEYTAASDVSFDVTIIEATHTVELTPDSPVVDSWLISALALGELRSRGIDTIVWNVRDYEHSFPKWKMVMIVGDARYLVKIIEVFSRSNTREFTVIVDLVPLKATEAK